MRILVVTPTFLPALGGAELVILQVCRRLALSHAVLVLTRRLSPELLEERASHEYDDLLNFPVRRYEDRWTLMRLRGHRVSQGLIPPFSLSAVRAIRSAAEEFHPDVINVHYVMPTGLSGVYAQKVLRVPVVITYNGRDVPGPSIPPLWKTWHRWVGRSCRDMTFVSRYCRDVIFGADSISGQIVPNGVDLPLEVSDDEVWSLRARLGIREGERVVFALQRLDELKRVDILIEAFDRVLRKKPNTRLVIGGKGADLGRLQECARKLGRQDRVLFAGYVSRHELPIYHTMADLFAFHSTYETFGMVLMEAMSYGKPVVSVDNTAIPEVVANGVTGLLVPTLDADAFAGALMELLDNEERRVTMGRKARERALASFTWDAIAGRYEGVLLDAGRR